MLIDSHCHLFVEEFDADCEAVLQRCAAADVQKILLPAIDSESHERLHCLCAQTDLPVALLPMMGLHPCSVKENMHEELALVKKYLDSDTTYYGVGEIGLDYYWDLSFKAQQIEAFEQQLQWAVAYGLPVSIHTREATADALALIRNFGGKVQGVFHCFSGTLKEAREVVSLGMYLGIGGVFTYKKTDLRETVAALGIERVVLETDSPYLPPVPHRGKRNEPAFIRFVAEKIADVLKMPYSEVARITSENAVRIFHLNN